jgi:UrcA family protein
MNTRRRNVRQLLHCCLAATLSCTACAAAFAADAQSQSESVVVRYDDLNLANPAGIEKLYQRIQAAARIVCGGTGTRSLQAKMDATRCREQAVSDAVKAVDNRILTAMHKEKASPRRLS